GRARGGRALGGAARRTAHLARPPGPRGGLRGGRGTRGRARDDLAAGQPARPRAGHARRPRAPRRRDRTRDAREWRAAAHSRRHAPAPRPLIRCARVSPRPADVLAWRPKSRPLLGLTICLALAGCVSTRLENRDWVRIQTAHYDVWSSLSTEDSMRLARDLEHFRAATEFISGQAIPATPLPTRVWACDDRGVGRPFSYRSQRSYLLTHQPGDVLVLRTGGGWEGDAWDELKLAYARRLLWNASPDALPPWLDEGLPQVASTLE